MLAGRDVDHHAGRISAIQQLERNKNLENYHKRQEVKCRSCPLINVFIAYAKVSRQQLVAWIPFEKVSAFSKGKALTFPFEDFHFFNSAYRRTATRDQPEPLGLTAGQLVPGMVWHNS